MHMKRRYLRPPIHGTSTFLLQFYTCLIIFPGILYAQRKGSFLPSPLTDLKPT